MLENKTLGKILELLAMERFGKKIAEAENWGENKGLFIGVSLGLIRKEAADLERVKDLARCLYEYTNRDLEDISELLNLPIKQLYEWKQEVII